ncbi:peptide deformylase [Spiroplasma endosymbiont of Aspidapion aeneum]|uniref:peptide deformylase n=1 Tax=Spiroplasma endosymbiont of Aspidapion aeneum TaxID=3066276 RepID=UPI00313C4E4A
MKFNKPYYFKQLEKPSNSWLFKDTNKEVIRKQSRNVMNVEILNDDEIICMNKLIDFVKYSQDENENIEENNNDYLRPAVGLAAPQIGVNKNLFYIRIDNHEEKPLKEIAAVNAKIISKSVQICAIKVGEGCLSVDNDQKGIVPRNFKIEVEYWDQLKNEHIFETLRGYEAIVFQHELDHINATLYYDHINKEEPFKMEHDWFLI